MEEKRRSRGWCGWFLVLIVVAVISCAIFYTVKQKMHKSGSDHDAAPVPGPLGAIAKKYAGAHKEVDGYVAIRCSVEESASSPWSVGWHLYRPALIVLARMEHTTLVQKGLEP